MSARLKISLAWLHLLFSVQVYAADLGRLFTTSQERSNLDTLRRNSQPSAMKERPEPQTIALPPAAQALTEGSVHVQGYVQRSDGKKATVWVNQQAMQEGSQTETLQLGKLGASQQGIIIRLPHSGKKLQLKPGQVYDPQQDRISEAISANKPSATAPDKAGDKTDQKLPVSP